VDQAGFHSLQRPPGLCTPGKQTSKKRGIVCVFWRVEKADRALNSELVFSVLLKPLCLLVLSFTDPAQQYTTPGGEVVKI
jgi:hypothetical protein